MCVVVGSPIYRKATVDAPSIAPTDNGSSVKALTLRGLCPVRLPKVYPNSELLIVVGGNVESV